MTGLRVKLPKGFRGSKAKRKSHAASNKAKHEEKFATMWKALYPVLPTPIRDYKFHPLRKFLIDFAWPSMKFGIEFHGGGARGRHNSVTGQASDCEKMNLAQRAGWRIYQFNVIRLKDMAGIVHEVAGEFQ